MFTNELKNKIRSQKLHIMMNCVLHNWMGGGQEFIKRNYNGDYARTKLYGRREF